MAEGTTDKAVKPGPDVLVLAIAKLLEAGDEAGAQRLRDHPELLDDLDGVSGESPGGTPPSGKD